MGTKETLEAIRAAGEMISALSESRDMLRQAVELAEKGMDGTDPLGLFKALEFLSEADEDDAIGMAMVAIIYMTKVRHYCRNNEVPEELALLVGVKR